MLPPMSGDRWLALTPDVLPVGLVYEWVGRPDCGAVVLFSGIVRNHAEGRDGVEQLDYEAYEDGALRRFAAIADEAAQRWPVIGRIALLHRLGPLGVGESAVLAAVSAPHRAEAFDASRYAIDTLKAAAPIWKRETWGEGSAWGTGAQPLADSIPSAASRASRP